MLRSLTGRQPQETQIYGGGAQSNVSQRLAAGSGLSSERSIKEKKMYGWTAYSLKKGFKRMCGMLVMLVRQYSACSVALSYFIAGLLCEL